MQISAKFSTFLFGMLVFIFLIFLLNFVPIKETCSCVNEECSVKSTYLSKVEIFEYNKVNDEICIKTHKIRNFNKKQFPLLRVVSLYKLEPIFSSDYISKYAANRDLKKIISNNQVEVVKYNLFVGQVLQFPSQTAYVKVHHNHHIL